MNANDNDKQRSTQSTVSLSRRGVLGTITAGMALACVKGKETTQPCEPSGLPEHIDNPDELSTMTLHAKKLRTQASGKRGMTVEKIEQAILGGLAWPLPRGESAAYDAAYLAAFNQALGQAMEVTFLYSDVAPRSHPKSNPLRPTLYCMPGNIQQIAKDLSGLDVGVVLSAAKNAEAQKDAALAAKDGKAWEAAHGGIWPEGSPIFQVGSYDVVVTEPETFSNCQTVSFYNCAAYDIVPAISENELLTMSLLSGDEYESFSVADKGGFTVRVTTITIPDPGFKVSGGTTNEDSVSMVVCEGETGDSVAMTSMSTSTLNSLTFNVDQDNTDADWTLTVAVYYTGSVNGVPNSDIFSPSSTDSVSQSITYKLSGGALWGIGVQASNGSKMASVMYTLPTIVANGSVWQFNNWVTSGGGVEHSNEISFVIDNRQSALTMTIAYQDGTLFVSDGITGTGSCLSATN